MPSDAGEVARQRIVAAGVEEQDVGLGLALHGLLHEIETHGLDAQCGGARKLGVHRHEVVHARDLQAVARIVEHAGVGAGKRAFEFEDLAVHGALVEVGAEDHREAQRLERGGHVLARRSWGW